VAAAKDAEMFQLLSTCAAIATLTAISQSWILQSLGAS